MSEIIDLTKEGKEKIAKEIKEKLKGIGWKYAIINQWRSNDLSVSIGFDFLTGDEMKELINRFSNWYFRAIYHDENNTWMILEETREGLP